MTVKKIGRILGAHGVKGLVKIQPLIEDLSLFDLAVNENGEAIDVEIKSIANKHLLATVEYIATREEAIAHKGTFIYIDPADMPAPDDGEVYADDLVGKSVIENGEKIGTILEVVNFGAEDLLDIKLLTGKQFYLPIRDQFIIEIGDDVIVQNHKDMIIE